MISRTRLFSATLLLFPLLLAACQTLPLNGKLPDNLAATKIASVDQDSPFAVAPDGIVVALVDGGLQLFHIPTRQQVPLSASTPRKLAWSPFGNSLAALFREGEKSRVITYDQYGTAIAEAVIAAPLTDIGWLSENELALGGQLIKSYKFGSNFQNVLYRWKPGRDTPVVNNLRNSTLQPATVNKWHALLARGPLMDFSSQTPLVSYLQPVEPPLFTPYYKVIVRDLASGRELEVATVSLSSAGARLSADGEKILFGDGKGSTVLRNPWSEEVLGNVSSPGLSPALSADAGSWFADGALFRNGALLTQLAPAAAAQFTPDGSRLVLQTGGDLYLLTGLKAADGALFVPALNEKIQKLRSLRAEGLISPKDYQQALARITQP